MDVENTLTSIIDTLKMVTQTEVFRGTTFLVNKDNPTERIRLSTHPVEIPKSSLDSVFIESGIIVPTSGLSVGDHKVKLEHDAFTIRVLEDDAVYNFALLAANNTDNSVVSVPTSAEVAVSGVNFVDTEGTQRRIKNFPALVFDSEKTSISFIVSGTTATTTVTLSANTSGTIAVSVPDATFNVEIFPDVSANAHPASYVASAVNATHRAVKTGDWNNPDTWMFGDVPSTSARVFIPPNRTVQYNVSSNVELEWIRNEGIFTANPTTDNYMVIDYLYNGDRGTLQFGTENEPLNNTIIDFTNKGDIDVSSDPKLFSRGFLSTGKTRIYGKEKDEYLRLASGITSGVSSVELEASVSGWLVGDKIVLVGSRYVNRNIEDTEDEEASIVAIDGATVRFDPPTQYPHTNPNGRPDLLPHVLNISRSIKFRTQNATSVSIPIHQRGHIMFARNADIDVRYYEAFELGRTNKRARALDVSDFSVVSAATNIRGRYSTHFHLLGTSDRDNPALCLGVVATGSPGWNFAHHGSHVMMGRNIGYNAYAASFVAENGSETGRWYDNFACRTIGVYVGSELSQPKNGSDVNALDFARNGHGYFWQGRVVENIGNIAAGHPRGQGFVYLTRTVDKSNMLPENRPEVETSRYHDRSQDNPAIAQFDSHEVYATNVGFMVIKAGARQFHDGRSYINDFSGWNIRYGSWTEYTGHYTYTDFDLYGTREWMRSEETSPFFPTNSASVFRDTSVVGIAAFAYTKAGDNVFQNSKVQNFRKGVSVQNPDEADPVNIAAGFTFISVMTSYTSGALVGNAPVQIMGSVETSVDLSFVRNGSVPKISSIGPQVSVGGIKTDSYGSVSVNNWDWAIFQSTNAFPNIFLSLEKQGIILENEGYFSTSISGQLLASFDQVISDRSKDYHIKVPHFIEFTSAQVQSALTQLGVGTSVADYTYHGELMFNQSPTSIAPIAAVSTNRDTPVEITLLTSVSNTGGLRTFVDGFNRPSRGWLTSVVLSANKQKVTYNPDYKWSGNDSMTVYVKDQNANFTLVSVDITVN